MTTYRTDRTSRIFLGVLVLYILGYIVARNETLHTVETYPNGKSGPRKDYITKRGEARGKGWEYKVFFPAIKVEEVVRNYL